MHLSEMSKQYMTMTVSKLNKDYKISPNDDIIQMLICSQNIKTTAPIQEEFENDRKNSDEDYNIHSKPIKVEKVVTSKKNEEKEAQDIEATVSVNEQSKGSENNNFNYINSQKGLSDDVNFYDNLIKRNINYNNKVNQFKNELKQKIMSKEIFFNENQLEFSDSYAELMYKSEHLSELGKDKYNLAQYFNSNTEYDPIKKRSIKHNYSCISSEDIKNRLQKSKCGKCCSIF